MRIRISLSLRLRNLIRLFIVITSCGIFFGEYIWARFNFAFNASAIGKLV